MLKKILSTTGIQLLITGTNFLFGLVMASLFGASAQMDAYVVVSNFIILVYGFFFQFQSKGLIPYMADFEGDEQKEAVNTILRFNLILFGVVSVVLFFTSRQVVFILAPGLESWQLDLSSRLMKVSAFYLFFSNFVSLSSALMEFHLKQISSSFINLFRAVSTLLFLLVTNSIFKIYSLPLAHIFGILIATPLFALFIKSKNYSVASKLPLINNHVKAYLRLITPIFVGQLMIWAIRLSDSFLASFLSEGSLSYISYSLRIVNNFNFLFAGFFIVYFPVLTRLSKTEDDEEYIDIFYDGFQLLFFVSLLLSLFIALFAPQIIELLFERGDFIADDTKAIANLIRFYSLMMFAAPMGSYLSNAYYGKRLPKKATIFSIISSVVNVLLNIVFIQFWGVVGLAVASSISYLVGNVLLGWFLKDVNRLYKKRVMSRYILQGVTIVVPIAVGFQFISNQLFAILPSNNLGVLAGLSILFFGYTVLALIGASIYKYPFAITILNRVKLTRR
jgi:putative peptidoglycan lipid II flippase